MKAEAKELAREVAITTLTLDIDDPEKLEAYVAAREACGMAGYCYEDDLGPHQIGDRYARLLRAKADRVCREMEAAFAEDGAGR